MTLLLARSAPDCAQIASGRSHRKLAWKQLRLEPRRGEKVLVAIAAWLWSPRGGRTMPVGAARIFAALRPARPECKLSLARWPDDRRPAPGRPPLSSARAPPS